MTHALFELLRKAYIPRFLKKIIRNFYIDLKSPHLIPYYFDSTGVFRPNTRISDTAFFYHSENIKIADEVFIWHYTLLDGTGGIEIGEGTQIGAWVGIYTHSTHIDIRLYGPKFLKIPRKNHKGYLKGPVKIGRYVFIGSGSIILHGVTIGDGSIISVNSVVNNDIPPYSIASGNPSKIVGDTRKIDRIFLRNYPDLKQTYYDKSLLGDILGNFSDKF